MLHTGRSLDFARTRVPPCLPKFRQSNGSWASQIVSWFEVGVPIYSPNGSCEWFSPMKEWTQQARDNGVGTSNSPINPFPKTKNPDITKRSLAYLYVLHSRQPPSQMTEHYKKLAELARTAPFYEQNRRPNYWRMAADKAKDRANQIRDHTSTQV